MKIIEVSKSKETLLECTKNLDAPIILTSDGKPIAAIVSVENADIETTSLSTDPQFISLIERSRVRQEQEGGMSSEEVRVKLGLK